MTRFNVAILGAGNIAASMAGALAGIKDEACAYAVASRDLNKAKEFAKKWGFKKAYGSYEELADDPEVDLIYVATPHSHHYQHAKMCLEHGKPVLVEKSFTANYTQAKELIDLAESKGIFLTEAMWTRYLPGVQIIKEELASGIIGEPKSLLAKLTMPLTHVPRLVRPELAGGSLLDLGVYALTFASTYFGNDIVNVESTCQKYETGVDDMDEINYTYADGKTAQMICSFTAPLRSRGTIWGTKGYIIAKAITNYVSIKVYDNDDNVIKECPIPPQVNGYEYEVLACKRAMSEGKLECEEMPHSETLEIMRQMDALRNAWEIKYPFE